MKVLNAFFILFFVITALGVFGKPLAQDPPLYGTYRPGVYVGIRPRTHPGVMIGLMWHERSLSCVTKEDGIREKCNSNGKDEIEFQWKRNDGGFFGEQRIRDKQLDATIESFFVHKQAHVRENATVFVGGEWDWSHRVALKMDSGETRDVVLYYYIALEAGDGSFMIDDVKKFVKNKKDGNGIVSSSQSIAILWKSTLNHSNSYESLIFQSNVADSMTVNYWGYRTDEINVFDVGTMLRRKLSSQVQSIYHHEAEQKDMNMEKFMRIYGRKNAPKLSKWMDLPNKIAPKSNILVLQIHFAKMNTENRRNEESADEGIQQANLDIIHVMGISAPRKFKASLHIGSVSSDASSLDAMIKSRRKHFDEQFIEVYDFQSVESSPMVMTAKHALSENLGSIGYFHGDSFYRMNDFENVSPLSLKHVGLLCAVPSRPQFPRGFLWDEGFHQLQIQKWNPSISMEILESWFALVDREGWVGREQILGNEGRSRVPREFVVQTRTHVNPPTLFLACEKLARNCMNRPSSSMHLVHTMMPNQIEVEDIGKSDGELERDGDHCEDIRAFIEWKAVPVLRRMFSYMITTQKASQLFSFSSVNGFTAPVTIGTWTDFGFQWSGRRGNLTLASGLDDYPRGPYVSKTERHLDLYSWVYMAAQSLERLYQFIGSDDLSQEMTTMMQSMSEHVNVWHWNDKERVFQDVHVIEKASLKSSSGEGNLVFAPHIGYISIFPLISGMIDTHDERLGHVLDLLEDPHHLWSSNGIRSLSASDVLYRSNEDYWRGGIWINIQYLILRSLHSKYARMEGPYQDRSMRLFERLRSAVLETIHSEHQRTGMFWEQYDPDLNGRGRRGHPFSGWTTLFTSILANDY